MRRCGGERGLGRAVSTRRQTERHPRVSVVIPVYNGERYLAEAVTSALEQTCPPHEVIVVDDGSTDASGAIAGGFVARIRVVSQAHRGTAAARNRAVALATGDALAFLDADDRWPLDRLARQVAVLADDPAVDLVFGGVQQVRQAGWVKTVGQPAAALAVEHGPLPSTMVARRSSYDRVGPLDERLRAGEFIDWYSRAMHLGLRAVTLPELVLWRRLHDANHGVRARDSYLDYLPVVKAALDRRRAREGRRGDG